MTIRELFAEVARRADTEGLKVSAAETSRVLATFFTVLNELDGESVHACIARGLNAAKRRASSAGASK